MPASVISTPEERLRDQRVMVGYRVHETPEQVEEAWQAWAVSQGFPVRRRAHDYTTDFHRSRKVVQAYVSGGSWTGDCPNCNGGIPTAPGFNDKGACLDCGTIYPIEYPSMREIEAAEEALMARPREARHWHPHNGEKAEDLRRENIVHGHALGLAAQEASDDEALAAFVAREGGEGIAMLRKAGVLAPDAEQAFSEMRAELDRLIGRR